MTLDNYKLMSREDSIDGWLTCENCDADFLEYQSTAYADTTFCSTLCESQQDDPGDSQDYVDRQNK